MYSTPMEPVLGAGVELEAHHDSRSASALEVPLLDLRDPAASRVGSIYAKVTEHIVMLGLSRL